MRCIGSFVVLVLTLSQAEALDRDKYREILEGVTEALESLRDPLSVEPNSQRQQQQGLSNWVTVSDPSFGAGALSTDGRAILLLGCTKDKNDYFISVSWEGIGILGTFYPDLGLIPVALNWKYPDLTQRQSWVHLIIEGEDDDYDTVIISTLIGDDQEVENFFTEVVRHDELQVVVTTRPGRSESVLFELVGVPIDEVRACGGLVTERPTGKPDETAKTSHIFPQIADGEQGDGTLYTSVLFVTNVDTLGGNSCILEMRGGVTTDRLSRFEQLDIQSQSRATLSMPEPLYLVALGTQGRGSLQTGYVTLECEEPVTAHLMYNYLDHRRRTISMATVFSSQPSYLSTYFALYGGGNRLALALANDTTSDAECDLIAVFADGDGGVYRETGIVTVDRESNLPRFVDELIPGMPDSSADQGAAALTIECDEPVASIGLYFSGSVFTTFPASVIVGK